MVFECGFETVGNATLILHDGGPLLATDPWISSRTSAARPPIT